MVRRYASKVWDRHCSLLWPWTRKTQAERVPRKPESNKIPTTAISKYNWHQGTLDLQCLCWLWGYTLLTTHMRLCDSFYGWDHHAAFPAMIDLIPCLRAFTDCLDTRQECDKGKDEAMWLIAAPGLSTRIQCVLRMRMPSCTSIQCQSNTSAQVSHQTVQSSPNHKSAQGETSQPPPSSNTCTLCWQCDIIW